MTEYKPQVGDHVRRKTSSHTPIGVVRQVTNDHAYVDFSGGFPRQGEVTKVVIDRLEQMCGGLVYSRRMLDDTECGRVAKEDGLCGVHMNALKRAKVAREAAQAKSEALAKSGREMLDKIAEYGLGKALPSIDIFSVEHQEVCVRLDELIEFSERI